MARAIWSACCRRSPSSHALAVVSRARRRPLETTYAPLRLLLGGHIVISDDGDLGNRLVGVDPIAVREIIDALVGDEPAELQVSLLDSYVVLRMPLDESLSEVRGGPLVAMAQSLQRYAGTPVETLAAGQVVLERFGGGLDITDAGVQLWLPRVQTKAGE